MQARDQLTASDVVNTQTGKSEKSEVRHAAAAAAAAPAALAPAAATEGQTSGTKDRGTAAATALGLN
jgi:hypothetical protein